MYRRGLSSTLMPQRWGAAVAGALLASPPTPCDAQILRSERDVRRVEVGCVVVEFTVSTQAGISSCYADNRRASQYFAGLRSTCSVPMRCTLRWNGSPDDQDGADNELQPGESLGNPTFGMMAFSACYDARTVPPNPFTVSCREVVPLCPPGPIAAQPRCACPGGSERTPTTDAEGRRQEECLTPAESQRRQQAAADASRRAAAARAEQERHAVEERRAADERRQRTEEAGRRRREAAQQQQIERRRRADEARQAEQTARSNANREGFQATAATMMGGLAGLSVSGDSSAYRGTSWRMNFSGGLGMAVIPAVSRGTSTLDSSTSVDTSDTGIFCPALAASLEFWPVHSPYFGVSAVVEGTAGWYGLSSTTMTTVSGAVGGRAVLGSPWIALLGEYVIGYRIGAEDRSYSSYSYGSYYSSNTSAEVDYSFRRMGAGLRLCFSRGSHGACETGADAWALREQPDVYQGDDVWGARLTLWSTNFGAIRGDLFWDYPRAGRSAPVTSGRRDDAEAASVSARGLGLLVTIVKSFDWFGGPYVSPSLPRAEPIGAVDDEPGASREPASVAVAPVAPTDRDGDGIDSDRCPDEPETFNQYEDGDGCPDDPDADADGVSVDADRCPSVPEDRDGFEDDDGCPDPDNDGDGVPDADDQCGHSVEDRDGYQDGDGCRDPDNDGDRVQDVDDRCPSVRGPDRADGCPVEFSLLGTIPGGVRARVEFRRRRVAAGSLPAVDEMVAYLNLFETRDRRFEVGGFVAGRRPGRAAIRRSVREAAAVRDLLVARGVDPSRLLVTGYGAARPLSTERSAAARALNHRIELRAVDAAGRPIQ